MRKIYLILGLVVAGFTSNTFAQGETCGTAVSVTPGVYTANGPSSGGGAVQDDGSGNSDWYSFTATCDGSIDVESCISGGVDTDLFLYANTCPTLESDAIAINDDGCSGTFSSILTGIPVTAGTTYYIEWGDQWSTAAFDWQLTFNGPTYNNVFSNTTFDATDLAWTAAGGETDWVVEWGIAGFTPGTGTIWNVVASPDTSITGLNPETTYDVIITGNGQCPEVYSFTTLPVCPPPTGPISTPGLTDAFLDWNPGGTEPMWEVEYDFSGFTLGTGNTEIVSVASDTTVYGLTGSTDYHWYVRAVCDVELPLDTFSLWVGPESFTTGQICNDPFGLDTVNSDAFNTDLTWSPGGLESEWNIQWGETGFTLSGTGSNTVAGVTLIPESLTGLTPGMTYDFYVQSVCGASADSMSMWVGPFTWTQPTFCNDPSAGGFTNLTGNSVDFGWTANGSESNWTVEYGEVGFTLGTGTSVPSTNDTISVTGLAAGTQYCFYVQANCGATPDSSSNYVGPFCITTPVTCPAPTNLTAINITNSAANLMWQAGGSETDWNVEWGEPGFTPGAGEQAGFVDATTDNPYYATSLNLSAPYEFYVQANCGGGDTSIWAGPFAFNTLLSNDDPCDAIKLTVDAPAVLHHNVGGTENGEAAISPTVGACDSDMNWCTDAQANYPVWFKFTAPAEGGARISTDNDYTDNAGSRTEIAVYAATICDNYTTYTMLGANTDVVAGLTGSEVTLCGLTPGQEYYVMLDGWSDLSNFFTPVDAFQGNFGISVEAIASIVDAGTAAPIEVCEGDANPVDLFNAITGNSSTDGTWYNPSIAPGNEYPNLLDFSTVPVGDYPFFYVEGSVCAADTVETAVSIVTGPNAGGDGTVTSCNTKDVILIQELTGSVELGGTWVDNDGTGALVNGVFESFGTAAGTYTFTYIVAGSGACPDDSATVTVTLTDCLGIDEEENTELSVFPNPVQDVLTIQNVNINTNFTVEVLDIQGKVVATENYSGFAGNLELNMNALEDGVYVVKLTSEDSIQKVRIIKQ